MPSLSNPAMASTVTSSALPSLYYAVSTAPVEGTVIETGTEIGGEKNPKPTDLEAELKK